jgi:amino-acid N-acetyltransferase
MNTQVSSPGSHPRRVLSRAMPVSRQVPVVFRPATPADAPALHELIAAHAEEGHLLPRYLDELHSHSTRFVVATRRNRLVACAELAPLSPHVAEVRSLVVDRGARARGIGGMLIAELQSGGRRSGFQSLCAFTHDAGYFVRLGFSLVPHAWVPEKVAADCRTCPLFRRCGQFAVVTSLTEPARQRPAAIGRLAAVGA